MNYFSPNKFPHLQHMSEIEREKLVEMCMPSLFGLTVAGVIVVVSLLMSFISAIAKFYGSGRFLAFVISSFVGGGLYGYLYYVFINHYLYKKTILAVQNKKLND